MADALTSNYSFVKPEVGASSDTWGTKHNSNFDDLDTLIKSLEDRIDALEGSAPDDVGQIKLLPWTGSIPSGHLECNGAAISRTTYSALFTKIGTTWGNGDGSTTFNIPDFRGIFPRGYDNGRGIDSGRVMGVQQSDQNKAHTHSGTTASSGSHTHTASTNSTGAHTHSVSYGTASGTRTTGSGPDGAWSDPTTISTSSAGTHSHTVTVDSGGAHTHTFTTDSNGGTEARPINHALVFAIRY